jgi:hypothetical protein
LKAREAIMSSPIHLDENDDPESIYTPRRARERIVSTPEHRSHRGRRAGKALTSVTARPPFSGDRAMLELQRQLALDPNLIPEPSSEADPIMRPLLVRLCSVTALAAFVAWGLASYSDVKKVAQPIPANTTTSTTIGGRDVADTMQALRLRPTIPRPPEAIRALGKSPAIAVVTADPARVPAAIVPAPQAAPVENPELAAVAPQQTNNRRELRLDSDEIATLVKRGQDFIADGDLAAARLLLRRAAEAGSAEAALTLGTTYDPVVLGRLGAIGTASDPAKARQWYQRAAELGSTAASQQLAGLGDPR